MNFESVTLKPAPALDGRALLRDPSLILSTAASRAMKVDNGCVSTPGVSLTILIMYAWGVKRTDLVAPDWAATTWFSLDAKLPEGASQDHLPEMLRNMLRDRFHIEVHQEQRETDGYALRTDGEGVKLKPAEASPDIKPRTSPIEDNPLLGTRLDLLSITMKSLANMASRYLGRPVLDETGMDGFCAMTLDVSMTDIFRSAGRSEPASLEDTGSTAIPASLRKQGLILAPCKVPVTLLIVDHLLESPTENESVRERIPNGLQIE